MIDAISVFDLPDRILSFYEKLEEVNMRTGT